MPEQSRLVVDASVVLKWQLGEEENVAQAVALRDDCYVRGIFNALAPGLLLYEITNGIISATRNKRISPPNSMGALNNLLSFGIEVREVDPLRVLEVALRYNIAGYDAAYLALAEDKDCDLWTGDRVLYNAVKAKFKRVKWIGDYGRTV
jgi:predicted nucleic acid-binding protein